MQIKITSQNPDLQNSKVWQYILLASWEETNSSVSYFAYGIAKY